jgi:hypothetical protein
LEKYDDGNDDDTNNDNNNRHTQNESRLSVSGLPTDCAIILAQFTLIVALFFLLRT